MDHELVPDNSWSAAVNTLLNTIIYESRKIFEYQNEIDLLLLSRPET